MRDGYFVVDRAYLRGEAKDAVRTFFMPFILIYRAARWLKERAR